MYLFTRHGNPAESGSQGGVAKTAEAEAKAIEAVAILPFEYQGGDLKTEPLSDGIPETVIHRLSRLRLPDLKVRSLLSVARYKGKKPDLKEIRGELGVGAIVTGRVQQKVDRLVVSVALTDVRDGSEIWSDDYDGKLDDILALQDQIAKDIAAHLRLRLTGPEESRLTKRETENSEAYPLYAKGRFYWNERTPEGLERAIKYFELAIKMDQNYALAWAGLANAYQVSVPNAEARPSDVFPKAKEAANKALGLDPDLADAYATLGAVAELEWNWSESESQYQGAFKLKANNASAHQWYAILLTKTGRFEKAQAQDRLAQEADPFSLIASASAGRNLLFAGRYDAAIKQLRKTLEMDQDFWVAHIFLAEALLTKEGKYQEALGELQAVERLRGRYSQVLALKGRAFALLGQRSDAIKEIEQLKALSQQNRYVPPCRMAIVYASLGENTQALDWLEKAYQDHDWLLGYLKVEPAYKGLHSEPRFAKLLRNLGLADKAAEREQAIRSVAVLPFVNEGGDPKTEFLSDGVAEQIINSLSQVRRKDLKIRPFTSVARYKGQKIDVPTFGRELNVQMIVTGTVRQQGDDLSISVALQDVQEDNQLWGDTYAGKLSDILKLQDRIARDVAAKMRLQLTGAEEQRLSKHYTEDPDAYLLYREATYHFNKVTPAGLETSLEYCRRALKKDPNYALAYLGLGRCYIILGAIYRGWRDNYAEAKRNLERALAIDNTLPEAHSGLGMLYMFHDWDWAAAKRELKSGVELDPASAVAQGLYGHYLGAMNRLAEALPFFRRSQELDPLNAGNWFALALCYNWLRQDDQAIAAATRALELDSNHPLAYLQLGEAYAHNDKCDKAIAELRRALDRGQQSPQVRGMLGYAYAVAGKRAEAQKVLDELQAFARDRFGFAYPIGWIYAALGDKDQAFCARPATRARQRSSGSRSIR